MKILLMGPVGSGKGTQGAFLSAYLGVPLISAGQVLRNVENSHPWYEEINSAMEKGVLVSHSKTAELLKQAVSKPGFENGYVMDGWGRAPAQLDHFDPIYDKVVLIKISPETSVSRLSTRRTCSSCGSIFNVVTVPPKVDGVCDKCGGVLKQRPDDTEESILKRLEIYNNDTRQTVEKFKSEGKLVEVDGEKEPDKVFAEIKKHFS